MIVVIQDDDDEGGNAKIQPLIVVLTKRLIYASCFR